MSQREWMQVGGYDTSGVRRDWDDWKSSATMHLIFQHQPNSIRPRQPLMLLMHHASTLEREHVYKANLNGLGL